MKAPHLGTFIWFQYLNFPSCACHQTSYISCTPAVEWVLLAKDRGMKSREIHEIQQNHEINENPGWLVHEIHEIHEIQRRKKERNLFLSISTLHTSSGLSVTQGLNMASTCVKVPPLGAFIWFQYLNFPPWYLSAISYIHSLGLKTSPLASKQLFACISTWFQFLSFPPCLSTTSCAHLSGFNTQLFPLCLSSYFLNFLHSLGFDIYTLQGVQRAAPCDTLGFPPLSHSALFFSNSTLCPTWGHSTGFNI